MNLFSKKILAPLLFGLSLFLLLSWFRFSNAAPQNPRFAIPVNCTLGQNCYIMFYVDRDPSPKAVDFGCGRQTYDGHKGTDFAISDWQVMAKGIPVVAAADGTVARVRDGMSDRLIASLADRASVTGQECGNGVVISHGNGWQSQYCHLRRGSVAVTPGTTVKKGETIGMVGNSGLASFPHVHLQLSYQNKIIDPFVGVKAQPGCQQKQIQPLWDRSLGYTPTGKIRSGFSSTPPNLSALWHGKFQATSFSDDIPALIFWVHNYGVLQGDRESFKLIAPDGSVAVQNQNTIDRSQKTWLSFVGKRNNPQNPLTEGIWRGQYQLKRGNQTIINLETRAVVN